MQDDWYFHFSDAVADEVSGFFKLTIDNEEDKEYYNVFWDGMGDKLRIVRHDIPHDLFEQNKQKIMSIAHAKSEEAYKEAMMGLLGR